MSGFIISEGVTAVREYAGITAGQTFDVGDPIFKTNGLLTDCVMDATPVLSAECVGLSLVPAEGIRAASRPADSATPALAAGFNGPNEGVYIPIGADNLTVKTRNFWATGAPGTLGVPLVSDIGLSRQISAVAATSAYGVEDTAAVATNLSAVILDVLNEDMLSIQVGYPGEGSTGVWVVFKIVAL